MRNNCLLPYFFLPNSNRPLYPVKDILELEKQLIKPAKEVIRFGKRTEILREKSVGFVGSTKTWRV